MSDLFYNLVVFVCRPAFSVSSNPTVLHQERIPRTGAFILAPTHLSAYDVPCLMHVSRRKLDFVSVVELFRKRFVGWFFRHMNAFPLDRGKVDTETTRTILERLRSGRAVVMFPEGHIRTPEESVLSGGTFNPAVLRLARLADVPLIPCVILGTARYRRKLSWLPLRRVHYMVAYGLPLKLKQHGDHSGDPERLRNAWLALLSDLRTHGARAIG